MAKFLRFLLIPILLLSLSSCEWINPEEPVPAYIRIDSVQFNPDLAPSLGSVSEITEAWVYVNGKLQGVYPIPAHFPVIDTGSVELEIKAGIKKNGIAASRAVYPFYTTYSVETRLIALQTVSLSPVFRYKPETRFEWTENFEDAGIGMDTSLSSQVPLEQVVEDSNKFGRMFLPDSLIKAECVSLSAFQLPANQPVFLEMEYRNDIAFTVGLNIFNPGDLVRQPVITIFPKETWSKIYIDLSYFATLNADAGGFTLFFGALKTDSTKTAQISFDNLKIIRF